MWRSWLNLFYPAHCLLCGAPRDPQASATHLCESCRQRLIPHQPPFCVACGRPALPAAASAGCPGCDGSPHPLERLWAAYPYDETLRRCIHLAKFDGKAYLLDDLGACMTAFAQHHRIDQEIDVIAPVPLHPVRLRERGYNQAERLARTLGRALDRPVVPALARLRPTPPQSRRNRRERLAGVRDAFAVRRPAAIAGRTILLVDDVATTGATLRACATALRQGGARQVIGFVLAHG